MLDRSTLQKACKRAALHTLGCRLNQSESLAIREHLIEQGYQIVDFSEPADLGIINTCTVTASADSKCRQSIRGFIRRNPEAFVAVVGCYSQMGAKEISEIDGVDLIIGNQDKLNVLDYVGNREKQEQAVIVRERMDTRDFTMHFSGDPLFSQRANLKIQDGCDFLCSFCIIPFARGRARSRDFKNLLEEARVQVARGVREIVLTGVNIGTYESGGHALLDIVDGLNAIDGLERIRISSIEPTTVPLELFERMADSGHILLPFLHLPLQSGSDAILKAMRRRYTVQEWIDFIAEARRIVPDLYVGSDVMVGFPGEGESHFEETCMALERAKLSFAHVFTYSERDGTLAAKRKELMVPMAERHRRSAVLRALSSRLRNQFYQSHLGEERMVLFESPAGGAATGLTDNFIRVRVAVDGDAQRTYNRFGRVILQQVIADFVEAKWLGVDD